MIKKVFVVFLIVLFFPLISSIDLTVEKDSTHEVSIIDLNKPTTFNLKITNNEASNDFKIYNLLGFVMEPDNEFRINGDETKDIQIVVYPRENFNYEGYYVLNYYIKDRQNAQIEEQLTINFIKLKDAFEITAGNVDPDSNKITLFIKNKENFDFGETNMTFTSPFFKIKQTFDISPRETKQLEITLNKEDFKRLTAGFYTLKTEVETQDINTKIEGVINFIEKDIVTTTSSDLGWFVNTKTIKKTNEGNIVSPLTVEIKKNLISRLFTRFSPTPDVVERKGFDITYTWNRQIKPSETLEIKVKTNWFYPFIIAVLILLITILSKKYSLKPLSLSKKVEYVKTKGGEFALKVTIKVKARKHIERINVIDRLPQLVKLYEKFGIERPDKIDEKNKRIEWKFERLEEGESRIVSYIVYSKVGVLGKFALPSATGVYEYNGKVHEVTSNKAFFVAEQSSGSDRKEDDF